MLFVAFVNPAALAGASRLTSRQLSESMQGQEFRITFMATGPTRLESEIPRNWRMRSLSKIIQSRRNGPRQASRVCSRRGDDRQQVVDSPTGALVAPLVICGQDNKSSLLDCDFAENSN